MAHLAPATFYAARDELLHNFPAKISDPVFALTNQVIFEGAPYEIGAPTIEDYTNYDNDADDVTRAGVKLRLQWQRRDEHSGNKHWVSVIFTTFYCQMVFSNSPYKLWKSINIDKMTNRIIVHLTQN